MENLSVKAGFRRQSGFTMVEMIAVMAIIILLMGAAGGAFLRAKTMGRRAKAESELRELVNAWQQYCITYTDTSKWPSEAEDAEVTENLLRPITDPAANEYGIVFFKLTLPPGKSFCDPWGVPYRLTVAKTSRTKETKLESSSPLPRPLPLQYAEEAANP